MFGRFTWVAGESLAMVGITFTLYLACCEQAGVAAAAAGRADPFSNVVQVEAQFATFDRSMPWRLVQAKIVAGEQIPGITAAGLVLRDGLILTSGDVAKDAEMIVARRQGGTKTYPATVRFISTSLNLALLEVEDKDFQRAGDKRIDVDENSTLPRLGSTVTHCTLKSLSLAMSARQVSEIKAETLSRGGRYGAVPQLVLALYPGSADIGPLFEPVGNALVGFIARNGMVVPTKSIAKFWRSVQETGNYSDPGSLGFIARPMQDPALRKFWDLSNDDVGVQVMTVDPLSLLHGKLKRGDVLVAVDREPVDAGGAALLHVEGSPPVAVPWETLVGDGEAHTLSFLRPVPVDNEDPTAKRGYKRGDRFNFTVSLDNLNKVTGPAAALPGAPAPPKYFMVGGLVWGVFDEGMLDQGVQVSLSTIAHAMYRWRANSDEEVIVLLRAIEHPCNQDYATGPPRALRFFNDEPVRNMEMFVQKVGAALQSKDNFLRFTFLPTEDADADGGMGDPDIVLATDICAGADPQLAARVGMRDPVSRDLAQAYTNAIPHGFLHGGGERTSSWLQTRADMLGVSLSSAMQGAARSSTHSNKAADLPWENVVHLALITQSRNFVTPWQFGGQSKAGCSAIIVDVPGRVILTNSHCVSGSVALMISREDSPIPVSARIIEFARDVDIAWITTDEESFWKSDAIRPSISMSEGLPSLDKEVRVVGFPMGGGDVTITKGVVSRVDGQLYPNGLGMGNRNTPDELLIIQIDAAINPGNSGGPVFDDAGRLLGLAFAGMSGAQSIGYVIPNLLLQNFMTSVKESGRWQAQPEIGAMFRAVENEGLRRFVGLGANETGVQVRSIAPESPLSGKIKKGDLLVRVDGHLVTGDGKFNYEITGRALNLPIGTAVTKKGPDEATAMEFLRVHDGKSTRIHINEMFRPIAPVCARFDDAPLTVKGREHFAAEPSYFMWWGLVWGVLSNPVIQQGGDSLSWSLLRRGLHRWRLQPDEEIVVLLQALPHECTRFYSTSTMRALQYFNGQPVNNLRDLVRLTLKAWREEEEFFRFTFHPSADEDLAGTAADPDIVLQRSRCGKSNEELMLFNSIPDFVSADLREEAASFHPNATSLLFTDVTGETAGANRIPALAGAHGVEVGNQRTKPTTSSFLARTVS